MVVPRALPCIGLAALLLGPAVGGESRIAGEQSRPIVQSQLSVLRESSDSKAALRDLAKMFQVEPVDASLLAEIEAVRLVQLNRLLSAGTLSVGAEHFEIADLFRVFQHLLTRRDDLQSRIVIDHDLHPGRFLMLQAAAGRSHTASAANAMSTHALPDVDVAQALKSPDPWVVAGALFFARKTGLTLSVADIMVRWQQRQGQWDDTCTEQALLYLAQLPRVSLAPMAGREGALAASLSRLETPEANRTMIHLIAFVQNPRPSLTLDFVRPEGWVRQHLHDKTMQVASESLISGRLGATGFVTLDAGYYSFKAVTGSAGAAGEYAGIYGESSPVRCEAGHFNRIMMALVGGV